MDKVGAVLADLDKVTRELHLIRAQEKDYRVPADQRRMTTEATVLLVRARARLEEKEGGVDHVHEG